MDLRQRISLLTQALSEGIYGKDAELRLSLLAAVSGESLFLIGPPGVAKSMIARRMKLAFTGEAQSFEYLMNRFSTPDEIFGPVSISSLRDGDNYQRMVEGYLPTAQVVFLDELWKASPSIQNTLLTVLNERLFRNGRQTLQLPLRLLIAASNELPAQGEGLEALWDRFLLRRVVTGISRQDQFDRMLLDTAPEEPHIDETLRISEQELQLWTEAIRSVQVPPVILSVIHHFRQLNQSRTDAEPLYVSDRRWRRSVNILRTSAFLHGNQEVSLADTMLLADVLWDEPSQRDYVIRLLSQSITAAVADHFDMELRQEQLDAFRDERGSHRLPASGGRKAKVVHTFYHQVQHRQMRPILMYISEYESLMSGQPEAFILIDDRKNTGAQILKKYERSRHPGIFPKDVIQVQRTDDGQVQINDKVYPLVWDEDAASEAPKPMADDARQALLRLQQQLQQCQTDFSALQKEQSEVARTHLFLPDDVQTHFRTALNAVQHTLNRLLGDCGEMLF